MISTSTDDRFGIRLRMLRAKVGMSQQALSDETGVTPANISRIESGIQTPTEETMARLLEAFETRVLEEVPEGFAPFTRQAPREREYGTLEEVDLSVDYDDPDFIIAGMVARCAVTMLAGAPGAGKSMLSQALALQVASGGGTVAGIPVQGGHVVMVDAENGKHLIVSRLKRMGLTVEAAHHLHPIVADDNFDIERQWEDLDALLTRHHPCDLLVLDSWASLWSGVEGWADAVKSCLNGLRHLAQSHDCGVILIHHTTKNSETYRGSGAIAGTLEAVFTLTRAKGSKRLRKIGCVKQRLAAEPDPVYLYVSPAGAERALDEDVAGYQDEEYGE